MQTPNLSQSNDPIISNDYHHLPATEKQIKYAQTLAAKTGVGVPDDVLQDRHRISGWIDAQKKRVAMNARFARYPSSKQVQFAERIARYKRQDVPDECFRDSGLMSKWIDCNK